jgi:hypothetical protein
MIDVLPEDVAILVEPSAEYFIIHFRRISDASVYRSPVLVPLESAFQAALQVLRSRPVYHGVLQTLQMAE